MKTSLKVLGPGCSKCVSLYNNVQSAIAGKEEDFTLEKIEDIMEMMQYNVLVTPVLLVNDKALVKGRAAAASEIRELLGLA